MRMHVYNACWNILIFASKFCCYSVELSIFIQCFPVISFFQIAHYIISKWINNIGYIILRIWRNIPFIRHISYTLNMTYMLHDVPRFMEELRQTIKFKLRIWSIQRIFFWGGGIFFLSSIERLSVGNSFREF